MARRQFLVYERIKVRSHAFVFHDPWSDWKEITEEEIPAYIAKYTSEDSISECQIARFYYNVFGEYIAWNSGTVYNPYKRE